MQKKPDTEPQGAAKRNQVSFQIITEVKLYPAFDNIILLCCISFQTVIRVILIAH